MMWRLSRLSFKVLKKVAVQDAIVASRTSQSNVVLVQAESLAQRSASLEVFGKSVRNTVSRTFAAFFFE